MPAFQDINQPAQSGIPQFQVTQPVPEVGGEAAVQVASVGAELFRQAAAAKQKSDIAEAKTAKATALGGLQKKLIAIKQAGELSDKVNVRKEQDLALSEFNIQNPELVVDAGKLFKDSTDRTVAGLSVEEQAEQKRRQKSLDEGFGLAGASDEYNERQHELRLQLEAEDRIATNKLKQIELSTAQASQKKRRQKEVMTESFQTLSRTYTEKTSREADELVNNWKLDPSTQESALLTLRQRRMELNRMMSGLGGLAQDPNIVAYTKPILDEIQLAEDIILQKIDTEAATARKERNLAVAGAMFTSDADRASAVVQSQLLDNAIVPVAGINRNVTQFITGGVVEKEFARLDALGRPTKAKPNQTDVTEHTEDDKSTTKSILKTSLNEQASPDQKLQAAEAIHAVVLHLERNGMDYDEDNIHYVVDILNTPGAIESMSDDQLITVQGAFSTYISDVVDVSVRKNITNPIITGDPVGITGGAVSFRGGMMVSGQVKRPISPAGRPATEVAELVVQGERIFWKLNPEHQGNALAQKAVREINRSIAEEIVPAVNVTARATGSSFQEAATALVLPGGAEEETDETKKTDAVDTAVGGVDGGKVEGGITEGMMAEAEKTLSKDALRIFSTISRGETTLEEVEATLKTSKSIGAMTPQEQKRLAGIVEEVKGVLK